MMRTVLSRIPLIQTSGMMVHAHRLYVRSRDPLPAVGESVVAMSNHNGKKFPGKVTGVDATAHTYDAVIDLSEEVTE